MGKKKNQHIIILSSHKLVKISGFTQVRGATLETTGVQGE